MQIENLPMPAISGRNDSEKLQNVISYLTQLFSALKMQFSSIDLTNMAPDLAEKIKDSISEHQDLSEYATRKQITDVNAKLDAKAESSDLTSNVQNLQGQINNHNHDANYSPIGHNHNGTYADYYHTHDEYATDDDLSDLENNIADNFVSKTWVQQNFYNKDEIDEFLSNIS